MPIFGRNPMTIHRVICALHFKQNCASVIPTGIKCLEEQKYIYERPKHVLIQCINPIINVVCMVR